jgi:hypothetical protein
MDLPRGEIASAIPSSILYFLYGRIYNKGTGVQKMSATFYLLSFRHRTGQEVQFILSGWLKILTFLTTRNLRKLKECGWYEYDVVPSSGSGGYGSLAENLEVLFEADRFEGIDETILGNAQYRDLRNSDGEWLEGDTIGLREIPN